MGTNNLIFLEAIEWFDEAEKASELNKDTIAEMPSHLFAQ